MKAHRFQALVVVVALSAWLGPQRVGAEAKKVRSVAVLPLSAKGKAHKELTRVLDDLLLSEIQAAAAGVRVVGQADIDAMLSLEKTRDMVGCDSTSCAAEIAGALGVDSVLYGSLATLGKKYVISLTWLHQGSTEVLARHSAGLGETEDTFDIGVAAAVKALVGAALGTSGAATGAATPAPQATSADGLVGHWLPVETSGGSLADRSGRKHTAYLTGGTRIVMGGPRGGVPVLDFDGKDDMVVVERHQDLEPVDALTVALWAKIDGRQVDGYADIYRQAGADLPGILLRWSHRDGNLYLMVGRRSGGFSVKAPRGNAPYVGAWHHLAATLDTRTGMARLFIDGEMVAVKTFTGILEYTDSIFLMHSPHVLQAPVKGQLHDVRVYRRALGPDEVAAIAKPTL